MDINRHYSRDVAEKLNEVDEVASVQFRGEKALPAHSEYAEQQNIQSFDTDLSGVLEVDIEQKIKPKSNFDAFREFVKDVMNYDKNRKGTNVHRFEYGEIDPNQFDKASVTVKEGETPLTFSLWEEKFLVLIHIDPDEYDIATKGGFPTPHTMGNAAREIANDLISERNSKLPTTSLIPPERPESTAQSAGIPAQDE
jgi:hypothetical protein